METYITYLRRKNTDLFPGHLVIIQQELTEQLFTSYRENNKMDML